MHLWISEKWPRLGAIAPKNGTLGGILNFSRNGPEVAGNWPHGGKLRLASILPMIRIPKSSGLGTFRALYGGLRAQNRKLANPSEIKCSSRPQFFVISRFFAIPQTAHLLNHTVECARFFFNGRGESGLSKKLSAFITEQNDRLSYQ